MSALFAEQMLVLFLILALGSWLGTLSVKRNFAWYSRGTFCSSRLWTLWFVSPESHYGSGTAVVCLCRWSAGRNALFFAHSAARASGLSPLVF